MILSAQHQESYLRQLTEQEWARAEQETASDRLNEYVADINLAQQSLAAENLGRALQLLNKHRPESGGPDLRGFEWRYLWNLCRGGHFHTFSGHSNFVTCVAFSPDGRTLASGSADGSVKLWEVANRRLMATLPAHSKNLAWRTFSNNGETMATAGDDGLKLWNVQTCRLIFTLRPAAPRGAAVHGLACVIVSRNLSPATLNSRA